MKTFLSVFVLILATSTGLFAQSYSFKVMANRGANQVKTAESEEWSNLKTGTPLNAGDQVKLVDGAYVGLVHNSGRTMEVKEAGEYKVDDFETKLSATSSSAASKYAEYVLNKMNGDENPAHRQSATGAVERATEDATIKVMMPNSVDMLNEKGVLRWNDLEGEQTYVVTFKNMFDEEIVVKETSDNSVLVDMTTDKMADETLIIVNVKVAGNEDMKSADYGIKRVTGEEAQELEKELTELKKGLNEGSALSKLVLASFYEQNNLLIDALTNYEEIIQEYPDVDMFQESYEQFLVDNGLSK